MEAQRAVTFSEKDAETLFEFFSESTSHWNFFKSINHKSWLQVANLYIAWKKRDRKQHEIPKVVHQIWLGAPPPRDVKILMDRWRDNPYGLDYRLWSEKDIEEERLELQGLYRKANNPAAKSDIARYEILKKYGGVYVDTDVELVKSVDDILCGSSFVAGCHPCPDNGDVEIGNAVIASSRNSSVVIEIVNELSTLSEIDESDAMTIIRATGPIMLTRVLLRNTRDPSVGILPSDFFYPFPGFLKDSHQDARPFVTSDTRTIHHWNCSWMKYLRPKRKRERAMNLVAGIMGRFRITFNCTQ